MPPSNNQSVNGKPKIKMNAPCLVVLAGPRFGETIPLIKGGNVVGSGSLATIQFFTTLMSEHHFTLIFKNQKVRLKVESGITSVNKSPVEEEVTLEDGDLIGIGGILLRYVEKQSEECFFVGDFFYGVQRRRFPRFNLIADADAFISGENLRLDILSVRDISRGGIGLFCKEKVLPKVEITVSLSTKNTDRKIVAESIQGTVANVSPWSDSIFLLNIRFDTPVSAEDQPMLHQQLLEMEQNSLPTP